jgi:iron complex outermembrane receptor protein
MQKQLFSLAAAAALGSALFAQSAITLEPLTVTSTPLQNTELNAPEAVEIYTKEEIEEAHVQSVYEFLTQQTSLFAVSSYGNPFAQKLDLHGYSLETGYQNIVIKINGRKINNVDMVPQLLASISPAAIDRIEIIKGSGIVTGGDGANAGVINITTKQNNDKSVTLYGGTYGTYDAAFNLGFADDFYTLALFGEGYHTDGTRHVNAAQDKDEQKMATGGFSLALTPVEGIELRAGANFSRLDATYGGYLTLEEYYEDPSQTGVAEAFQTQQYDTESVDLGISYFIGNRFELGADVSKEKKRSDYAFSTFFDSTRHYDYRTLRAYGKYSSEAIKGEIGLDLFQGGMKLSAAEMDKDNTAGYATLQYQTGAHTVQAGYRFEQVAYDYSPTAAPSDSHDYDLHGVELGYNYAFSSGVSLFASYARGYQAPDLDRFFNFGGGYNGNIKPMTSDTVTLGYNRFSTDNKFKLSIYYAALEDEIYLNPITFENTNIDRSHKYGLDLYDRYRVSDRAHVTLNYGFVRAIMDRFDDTGSDFEGNTLPMVPTHNISLTYAFEPAPFTTLALTQVYRSEAFAVNDFGNDFAQKNDAYNTTNVSATYAKENYELFVKINNLFNQRNGLWIQDDTIYPVDFTTTAIAGLKLKF